MARARPFVPAHRGIAARQHAVSKLTARQHQPKPEEARRKSPYNSRRWREASREFRKLHPLCAECRRQGRTKPAIGVDHVIPHRGNMRLFWDTNNWESLCHDCHSAKTGRERRGEL
jgi:5-methylcytosine-specific restriction protein A